MSRRVHRTAIAADDQWHTVELRGPILHVATREEHLVEIWHLNDDRLYVRPRTFRVFGDGQEIDEDADVHVGSAVTPNDGRFVWHVYERWS